MPEARVYLSSRYTMAKAEDMVESVLVAVPSTVGWGGVALGKECFTTSGVTRAADGSTDGSRGTYRPTPTHTRPVGTMGAV